VTIPLHQRVTIFKATWQKIDKIRAAYTGRVSLQESINTLISCATVRWSNFVERTWPVASNLAMPAPSQAWSPRHCWQTAVSWALVCVVQSWEDGVWEGMGETLDQHRLWYTNYLCRLDLSRPLGGGVKKSKHNIFTPWQTTLAARQNQKHHTHTCFDWYCFYYIVRNSLVALLEALCARILTQIHPRGIFHSERHVYLCLWVCCPVVAIQCSSSQL